MKFGGLSSTGAQHGCRAPPTASPRRDLCCAAFSAPLWRCSHLRSCLCRRRRPGRRARSRAWPSTPGGWRTRRGSSARSPISRPRASAGPEWTCAGCSSSPRVRLWPRVGRDWSEMDAIVAAAHRHGIKLLPIVAYVTSLGQRRERLVGLPRHPAFRGLLRGRPAPLSPHLRLGALERAQLRCLRQATARSGRIRCLPSQRASGARAGGFRRQADLRRPCPGNGDRHRRLGGRDGSPGGPRAHRRAGRTSLQPGVARRSERLDDALGASARSLGLPRTSRPAALADRVRRARFGRAERLGPALDRGGAGPAPARGVRPGHPPALRREPDLVRVPRYLRRPRESPTAISGWCATISRPGRPSTPCAR